MKKILLPVDGSRTCVLSLEYAKQIAEKFDSEIVLVNVQNISTVVTWGVDSLYTKDNVFDPHKMAEEIIKDAAKTFEGTGIKVILKSAIGDPAVQILKLAESEDCDVIIMCTHGMSATKRFLLGSVTNKVVHHAHIPVLVVR